VTRERNNGGGWVIECTDKDAERALREFIARQNPDLNEKELSPSTGVPPSTMLRVPKRWRVEK
jgi:hypothetical protein